MVKVGIVGVTGYTGYELIKILINHPKVKITGLFSKSAYGKPTKEVFPEFSASLNLVCRKPEATDIARDCNLVFLALPHTASMEMVPGLIRSKVRVIDLSADYRLKDLKVYSEFYGVSHADHSGVKQAIYGLAELYKNKIKNAKLVANPGCYPTAAILSLAPLFALKMVDVSSVIIDAKSGISGAGRKKTEEFYAGDSREDFKAYKVGAHQHMPEISQELFKLGGRKVSITFVPHLLPVNRGILETIYVKKKRNRSAGKGKNIIEVFKKFYEKAPFVRIKKEGEYPAIKDVVNTNFCDIGIKENKDQVIIISAIDNLLKGASGQAVQNMNIMYGFPETLGLL